MIIIGIDPGLVNTGYGIISIKNEIPSLIDFGIIAPNTKDSVPGKNFYNFYGCMLSYRKI